MTDAKPTPDARADQEPVRPDPAGVDSTGHDPHPPKAGSQEAMNEERKTQPARTRGAADV